MRKGKISTGFLVLILALILAGCSVNVITEEVVVTPAPVRNVSESLPPEPLKEQGVADGSIKSLPKETSGPISATEENEVEQFCTLTVRCDDVLKNIDKLSKEKVDLIPADGIILAKEKIVLSGGESVFDVLYKTLRAKGIHIEYVSTPMYNSVYIEGIANLYEFDCGDTSGWTYTVNNERPMHGSSQHTVESGDDIEFLYVCSISG